MTSFAFFDQPEDCRAGLSLGGLLEKLENLLQAVDLHFGFVDMLLERRAQLFGVSGLCHLWQSHKDYSLRVVDVFQNFLEEVLKCFALASHYALLG